MINKKNIAYPTSFKDILLSHTKSYFLIIGTPWDPSRNFVGSHPSLDQVEQPLDTMIGHGKGIGKIGSALVKQSVMALPVSSGSCLASSSSSQGLVPYPKKKSDSKGEPTYRTKDKH